MANSLLRPVAQWASILAGLKPDDAADRVLADLVGYDHRSPHRKYDAQQLAVATKACTRLTTHGSAAVDDPAVVPDKPKSRHGLAAALLSLLRARYGDETVELVTIRTGMLLIRVAQDSGPARRFRVQVVEEQ